MAAETPRVPLLLLCDRAGAVVECWRDDLDLQGTSLAALLARDSFTAGLQFLATIQKDGAAVDWPVVTRNGTSLTLSGAQTHEGVLVVGATPQKGELHEEWVRMTSEQGVELRRALKELFTLQARDENSMYEELSRLNNELATAQRELARHNRELAEANALKNQFLGMAAHDLRNPLDVISTYSGFLRDELTLEGESGEMLTTIERSARFMLELVENLLEMARADAPQVTIERSPTDLASLLATVARQQQALAERKRTVIETRLVPVTADLDAARIEQVAVNLLSNAVKYSPPDSTVHMRLFPDGGRVVMEIADEGPGIAESEKARLFVPFSRLSSARGEKGSGLGLAIVSRIVQAHGGAITVHNHGDGPGCTFRVELPKK